jgi:hypothetical protein
VALLVAASIGLLAAPITILRVMPGVHTRTGRHTLVGALALVALAMLSCVLALVPIRRGERWAVAAAALPFLVVGFPIFVVDATYVARPRLWNTLAPQAIGLLTGMVALFLCAIGAKKE